MNKNSIIIFLIFAIQFLKLFSSSANNYSAFNEVLIGESTPVVQLQFPYNLLPDYTVTSLSGLSASGGNVFQGTGMAFISTSGQTGAVALLASKARVSYQSGQGVSIIFSAVFGTGTANNVQYIGAGNAQDGFFFGYTGTQFGILHRNVTGDTWIPTGSWNGDPLNGAGASAVTLNPQYGNTYKIQYQCGFGVIKFYVQNPSDGTWITGHTIQYPNSTGVAPSIRNPSMQLLTVSQNLGNATGNVTLKTAGMMGAIEGVILSDIYPRFSRNFIKPSATTTNQNVLSIMNNTGYAGTYNQAMVCVDNLSVMNTSTTTAVVVSLFLNPSVSGASYVSQASNSVVSYDTTGTGIAGGRQLLTVYVANAPANNGVLNLNLYDQKICVAPGDRLVVAAQASAGSLTNIGVALSWIEKQ